MCYVVLYSSTEATSSRRHFGAHKETLTEEPLSVEEMGWLRDQLCPKAEFSADAKVEDILRYWIEHESNPTREKLSELLKTLPAELPG